MKTIVLFGLIALILLSGCISATGQTTSDLRTETPLESEQVAEESGELRQAELAIEGLWCESCVYGIEAVMKQTPGVQFSTVEITDYVKQTGIARVLYDSSEITKEEVASLTEPYPSTIVKDELVGE